MDTLKPISKEISTFNSCASCKYFHTECTEKQRKYNATSDNECWEKPETPTNETLEEVALKLSEQFEENKDGFEERSDFYYGVIAGYKHCEKTMKAQYDELYALYVEATRN